MSSLLQQARLYKDLNRQVKAVLDSQMAEHCQVSCVRNGQLVILTPTPVWRNRLMLLSSSLLSSLRNNGHPGLAGIEVKISPLQSDEKQEKQPRSLSPAAKTSLARFAESCQDPSLRAIARRLADSD